MPRQVHDTGLAGGLASLSEMISKRRLKREENQVDLEKLIMAARASKMAEREFPSVEDQIRQRALGEIDGMQPRITGVDAAPDSTPFGLSPQQPGNPYTESKDAKMQALLGLIGKGNASMVSPIIFDPNTRQYVNMSGEPVNSFPKGTPVRNAPLTPETLEGQSAGRSKGTGSGKEKILLQARSAKEQINQIYATANQDLPAFSDDPNNPMPEGMEAILGGIGRKIQSKTGFNESARSFLETNVGNARQAIRGLGEVGVLTDRDVEDAIKLLPASTDSATVRQNKQRNLNALIDAKIKVYEARAEAQSASSNLDPNDFSQYTDEELQAMLVE